MSVHNESLDLHTQTERNEEAPGLEYRAVSHDSLSMFLAAMGGAILGVLLTLLILAIINGGTLNFAQRTDLATLALTVNRVNENLGTLSGNVDVIAGDLASIQSGMQAAEGSLRAAVADQSVQVAGVSEQMTQVNEALVTLEQTRQRFDIFVSALNAALAEMQNTGPAAAPITTP